MAENDDDRRLGAAPPLVPGPSLEAEEKAMRGGRGGLVAAGVVAVLIIVAAVVALVMGDDNSAYETLGRNVNGAKGELFDGFWHCTFQNDLDVRSNEDLMRELEQRANRGGKRFGEHVRDDCLPKLTELEPRLDVLIPPDDMRPALNDVITATRDLRGAWSDYLAYLDALEGPYDEEEGHDRVVRIARGWFDFKHAHKALNDGLREHLH
ncbi:MAG: hypothetical protein JJ863_36525 [Deltaproteobacteria bacterium]|nr:hypothetical protein [Deltaproteobacteria bacterium]